MTLSNRDGARLVGEELGARAMLSAILTHVLVQDAKWEPKLRGISRMIDEQIRDAKIENDSDLDQDAVRRAASAFTDSILDRIERRFKNVGVDETPLANTDH
ncbi:MAG TPA: hypothetical protein VL574_10550 [Stellaceae bacterium]|jgi:hypothetical protein|nr:hypothetical protein [Stellaceae bacterium]